MFINEIQNTQEVIDNNHESLFKSYQTLQLVTEMVKRRDSHDTILMVINTIYDKQTPSVRLAKSLGMQKIGQKRWMCEVGIFEESEYGLTKIEKLE